MAKKMSLADKKKAMAGMISKINDKVGKSVMGFASDPDIQDKLTIEWIPMPSLRVNEITGGGIPKGKVTILAGDSDSGKTSSMLETIGMNMKKDPDFMAIWLESEESLELKSLVDTFGIDLSRFVIIYLERDGAAEVALDRLEATLATGIFDLCVINSLKCLTPSTEFEKEMSAATIGLQARMFGKLMRKMVSLIAEHNCGFVLINHLTTEIGKMHGDPLTIAGGRAIRYSSMLTLDMRKRSIQESDPISREDGMKINVTVHKNHCRQDRMPYLKTDFFVVYGQGTERSIEIIELAEKCGILTKKGSWFREYSGEVNSKGEPIERILADGTKAAWNGMKNTRAYIVNNPDYYDYLVNRVENFGKIDVETLSQEEVEAIEAENKLDAVPVKFTDNKGETVVLDEVLVDPEEAGEAPKKKKTTKKK